MIEYFSFFPDSNFLELFKIFSFQFMSTALLARVVSLSIYAEYAVLIEYYVPNGALWWLEWLSKNIIDLLWYNIWSNVDALPYKYGAKCTSSTRSMRWSMEVYNMHNGT